MAEPKAKTLQQKLGFFDEDLKSPVTYQNLQKSLPIPTHKQKKMQQIINDKMSRKIDNKKVVSFSKKLHSTYFMHVTLNIFEAVYQGSSSKFQTFHSLERS